MGIDSTKSYPGSFTPCNPLYDCASVCKYVRYGCAVVWMLQSPRCSIPSSSAFSSTCDKPTDSKAMQFPVVGCPRTDWFTGAKVNHTSEFGPQPWNCRQLLIPRPRRTLWMCLQKCNSKMLEKFNATWKPPVLCSNICSSFPTVSETMSVALPVTKIDTRESKRNYFVTQNKTFSLTLNRGLLVDYCVSFHGNSQENRHLFIWIPYLFCVIGGKTFNFAGE